MRHTFLRSGMTFIILLLGITWLGANQAVGYAFSGGGARGYAHIGILKVLEENGIRPDYITGTSMGAIVGALYAIGYNAAQIEELMLRLNWDSLLDDVYPRKQLYIGQKRWAPYGAVNLEIGNNWQPRLPSSVWVGNGLNLELARIFAPAGDNMDFTALPIPYACVATDLLSGEPVIFSRGNLMQAVRASLSIPSLIQPFELDGHIYIDGGVSQNLPIKEVIGLGADYVVGVKTNSGLRSRNELGNLIQVLDQTINIGMTRNLNAGLEDCDLLLEPELEGYHSTDYNLAAQIIAAGEAYARDNLDRIVAFRQQVEAQGPKIWRLAGPLPSPGTKTLTSISCTGNDHLSLAKIRDYMGITIGGDYSADQLVDACRDAWHSQMFHTIYPVIATEGETYKLRLFVKERTRRQLGIQLSYSSEEGPLAGGILKLNNILLKNSILQAALTMGGKTEVNLDYVKNFGELWGSYFRVYSYFSENRRYYYDESFNKVASVKAAELGLSGGLGIFANKLAVAEAFIYGFRTRLYRDISTVAGIDSLYLISGAGVKLYHESLDDYYFPSSGFRLSLKFNFARSSQLSDYIYSKVHCNAALYTPFNPWLSLKTALDLGSWFGKQQINIDPFYLGGSNGYLGYQKYEISAPVYKTFDVGLTAEPQRNIITSLGVQGLSIGDVDDWSTDQKLEGSLYLAVGYRTALGPLRFSVAFRENSHPNYYLNLGYDLDVFHFSRR